MSRIQVMLRFAVPLLLAALFAGCVTSSPYDRGSLSEAMERAPNEDPAEREVPNRRDDPPRGSDRRDPFEEDPFEEDDWFEDHHEPTPRRDSEPRIASDADTLLGMRFGSAIYSSRYFDPRFDTEAFVGFDSGATEVHFFGGLKLVEPKANTALRDSIQDTVALLRAGVEVRLVPFEHWRVFSPYGILRAGGLLMTWRFENPLIAGVEEIAGDSLGGMMLGAGVGVNIVDGERFRLGAALIPETNLFFVETSNGFENDVFSHYGTTQLMVELSLRR